METDGAPEAAEEFDLAPENLTRVRFAFALTVSPLVYGGDTYSVGSAWRQFMRNHADSACNYIKDTATLQVSSCHPYRQGSNYLVLQWEVYESPPFPGGGG